MREDMGKGVRKELGREGEGIECEVIKRRREVLYCTVLLTSGLDMKEMASPLVPNLPARPTLCKYWSLCSSLRYNTVVYVEEGGGRMV
jgi:hypothetical protein